MIFYIIRIVMLLLISILAYIVVKKSKIIRKKLVFALSLVICFAMIVVSGMFPVENLFVSYKSPESVFNYANFGKTEEIIYGQNSCLIVYSKGNNTIGHYIIPKTNKGYKIPNYFTVKKVSHKFDKNGLFDVYNVKETQDYYIFGTVYLNDKGNEIYIYNEMGEKVESKVVRIENTSFIYFYLHDFSSNYYLSINGNEILISE